MLFVQKESVAAGRLGDNVPLVIRKEHQIVLPNWGQSVHGMAIPRLLPPPPKKKTWRSCSWGVSAGAAGVGSTDAYGEPSLCGLPP
jgi:hypothetical protein